MTTRAAPSGDRLSSLGRAIIFVGVAVLAVVPGIWIAGVVAKNRIDIDHPSIAATLIGNAVLVVLTVILPALVVRRAFGESWMVFGLGGPNRTWRLLIGMAAGLGAIALPTATLAGLGVARLVASAQPPSTMLVGGLAYLAAFALIAVAEEGLFRGYLLYRLGRAIGFWPAALATSAIFAALHLVHGGETPVGLAQVALFGLVMALIVRATQDGLARIEPPTRDQMVSVISGH